MIMRFASIASAVGLALVMAAPSQAQQGPGAGAGAEASEREGRGKLAACRTDVATICKGVEGGGGRKMACLNENLAKLSPECAEVVEGRAAGKRERGGMSGRSAAGVGARQGIDVAQGPTVPNQGQAPAAGATSGTVAPSNAPVADTVPLAKGKSGKRGRMAACRTDMATFCQSAEKGGGRMKCLKENQAKLSPECQTVLGERVQEAGSFRQACKADRETLCAGAERGRGQLIQCLKDNQAKLSPACGEAITAMPEHGAKGRGKRAESTPRQQ